MISEGKAQFNVDLKRATLLWQNLNMMDTTEVKYMKYLMKEFQKENEIINGQNELNVPKELS